MKRRVIQRKRMLTLLSKLATELEMDVESIAAMHITPTMIRVRTIVDRDLTEQIDVVGPPTVGS